MKRKIVIGDDESGKTSIAEKMRAEIEEQVRTEMEDKVITEIEKKYERELEEKIASVRKNYQLMLEQETKTLETKYRTQNEESEEKVRAERDSLKKQKDKELAKLRKRQEELTKKIEEERKKEAELDERISEQRKKGEELEKRINEQRKKEEKLDEIINEEKRKCSSEIEKIKKETNNAIIIKNFEIRRVNEIIKNKNNNEAEIQALKEKINAMGEIINKRKGKKEETITSSVFDISGTGAWYEIGQMILEKGDDKEKFTFSDDKLSLCYSEDKRYPDGIIIEKGKKTSVVAVHEIVEKDDTNESLIRFYSDSKVVPIYNLLGVLNCILHIYQTGFNIKAPKQAKGITIKCLVYSENNLKDINNELYSEHSSGAYLLTYKDNMYTNIGVLAQKLYKRMHCSKKGVSSAVIDMTESVAVQKSMQIEGKGEYIDNIQYLSKNDEDDAR